MEWVIWIRHRCQTLNVTSKLTNPCSVQFLSSIWSQLKHFWWLLPFLLNGLLRIFFGWLVAKWKIEFILLLPFEYELSSLNYLSMLLSWHTMKSALILTFKTYKMAETGLQLPQTGTDPLTSIKSLQSFRQNAAGLTARVDLFHLWSASRLPYIQNQERSWTVAHSGNIKCVSERFLSSFDSEFLTNGLSLVLGHFTSLLLTPCYLAYSLPWSCFFCAAAAGLILLVSCHSLEDGIWQFTACYLIVPAILSSRGWPEYYQSV